MFVPMWAIYCLWIFSAVVALGSILAIREIKGLIEIKEKARKVCEVYQRIDISSGSPTLATSGIDAEPWEFIFAPILPEVSCQHQTVAFDFSLKVLLCMECHKEFPPLKQEVGQGR